MFIILEKLSSKKWRIKVKVELENMRLDITPDQQLVFEKTEVVTSEQKEKLKELIEWFIFKHSFYNNEWTYCDIDSDQEKTYTYKHININKDNMNSQKQI